MNGRKPGLAMAGFLGGIALGTWAWSALQRQYRRALFSRHPARRFLALSYLRAKPTVQTARLLREYIAWEPMAALKRRGTRLLRHLESSLQ